MVDPLISGREKKNGVFMIIRSRVAFKKFIIVFLTILQLSKELKNHAYSCSCMLFVTFNSSLTSKKRKQIMFFNGTFYAGYYQKLRLPFLLLFTRQLLLS